MYYCESSQNDNKKINSRRLLILQCPINITKIKYIYNQNLKTTMKRFLLRPIFDAPTSFFPIYRTYSAPSWRIRVNNVPREPLYSETQLSSDPHEIFEQFYKENEIKSEAEKDFFRKHYPEKVEQKLDPYKILQINKDASIEDVKEAYRNLAIKYHPKNNASQEAQLKFAQVSKAYSTIVESKKNKTFQDYGFNSFFEDFEKEIEAIFGKTNEGKQGNQDKEVKTGKQQQKSKPEENNYGELYSQSSHYQTRNGQHVKYVLEKVYKKDGKFLTVKREEKLKDDGKVQITEMIDNGKQVKKKTYIHENDVKKID